MERIKRAKADNKYNGRPLKIRAALDEGLSLTKAARYFGIGRAGIFWAGAPVSALPGSSRRPRRGPPQQVPGDRRFGDARGIGRIRIRAGQGSSMQGR